jgi:hypothetical protein
MKKIVTKLTKTLNLTPNEAKILNFYLRIAKDGHFCASRKTVAEAVGLAVTPKTKKSAGGDNRTVRTLNSKLESAGILTWIKGNGNGQGKGQANRYRLDEAAMVTASNSASTLAVEEESMNHLIS